MATVVGMVADDMTKEEILEALPDLGPDDIARLSATPRNRSASVSSRSASPSPSVRLLIDNNLAPALAEGLRLASHDATHARDLGLQAADDPTVFGVAEADDRIIVSADTDFGMLLATRRSAKPSVVLFRRTSGRRAVDLALLTANLPMLAESLEAGCIVVFQEHRILGSRVADHGSPRPIYIYLG